MESSQVSDSWRKAPTLFNLLCRDLCQSESRWKLSTNSYRAGRIRGRADPTRDPIRQTRDPLEPTGVARARAKKFQKNPC
jgi:hypothetical protein